MNVICALIAGYAIYIKSFELLCVAFIIKCIFDS